MIENDKKQKKQFHVPMKLFNLPNKNNFKSGITLEFNLFWEKIYKNICIYTCTHVLKNDRK